MNPPPICVGIFTALLRQNGFEVELFDSTLYNDENANGSDEAKEECLQVRPFSYSDRGVRLNAGSMEDDLVKKIEEYMPDLIAMSILECTYPIAVKMLDAISDIPVPVIAGGVFPTFAAKSVLSRKNVTMVCIGEGEEALVEVCRRMATGADCSSVKNIWIKKDGRIIRNGLTRPVDINSLPIPDYSLFDPQRFFRPMAGKMYRTVPIETARGCPYLCAFCNSPSISRLYKRNISANFYRKKKVERIREELKYLIERWDAEYVYFTSDTFLATTDEEFFEFAQMYEEFSLPFWIQSRPETITKARVKRLKDIGCHRMSIGLEHGNNEFRKRILNKRFDNRQAIRASEIIADVGIPLTVNNIIGLPDETRELVFDTIELNRKLTFDTTNALPFAPFHGTPLHQLCVERGYISEEFTPGSLNLDAPLDMPQLSREEIKGLRRTFPLYARMPKDCWSRIKKAEKFDEEGNHIYAELRKTYQDKYFI
jgi:radical SAM superfamily enzyme YgiQ (UPF0313 family)